MAHVAEGRIDGSTYRVSVTRMIPTLSTSGPLWELRIQIMSAGDGVLSFQLSGVMNPVPRQRIRWFLCQQDFPSLVCDGIVNFIFSLYNTEYDFWKERLVHVQIETNYEEEDYDLRPTPTNRDVVDALEKVTFGPGTMSTSCVVCLDEISNGSEVTKMPCSHVFHGDCIVRWLENRSVCPLCRFELPSAL